LASFLSFPEAYSKTSPFQIPQRFFLHLGPTNSRGLGLIWLQIPWGVFRVSAPPPLWFFLRWTEGNSMSLNNRITSWAAHLSFTNTLGQRFPPPKNPVRSNVAFPRMGLAALFGARCGHPRRRFVLPRGGFQFWAWVPWPSLHGKPTNL